MSNDLNQCQFIGRLGKDPEMRFMPSGGAVASFSIACSESWKDKTSGEKVERTEWVNVSAFGKLAEIIEQYLKKGNQVYISGKMKTDKYEKDGVTKYSTKIIANNMQMLGSAAEGGNAPKAAPAAASPAPASTPAAGGSYDDFDDDIPF